MLPSRHSDTVVLFGLLFDLYYCKASVSQLSSSIAFFPFHPATLTSLMSVLSFSSWTEGSDLLICLVQREKEVKTQVLNYEYPVTIKQGIFFV